MSAPRGVAFVGAGFISYMHQIALRAVGPARLVALASQTRRGATHRAHVLDAEPYTFGELDAMLGRDDVDCVFVLSPNALHADHAIAAVEAGKHVVLEKPMALTPADAERIAEAAAARGVGLGYAENQVFSPITVRARELVTEGVVGKVLRVVGFCGHAGPARGSWFWDPRWAGGGAQFDMGSHTIETSLFLAGKPAIEAVVRAELLDHPSGVDGRGRALLASEDGIEFDLTSSFVEPSESISYEVHGDAGVLRVVWSPAPVAQRLVLIPRGGEPQDLAFSGRGEWLRVDRYAGSMGYVDQWRHFAECFAARVEPREGARDGLRVVEILAAIYAAAGRGRSVRLSEVPRDVAPLALWKGRA